MDHELHYYYYYHYYHTIANQSRLWSNCRSVRRRKCGGAIARSIITDCAHSIADLLDHMNYYSTGH